LGFSFGLFVFLPTSPNKLSSHLLRAIAAAPAVSQVQKIPAK